MRKITHHLISELQENESVNTELIHLIPQIVITAGPDGAVNFLNRKWFETTGLTQEESIGWGWFFALHKDDLQRSLDLWNKSIETGENFEIEFRLKHQQNNTNCESFQENKDSESSLTFVEVDENYCWYLFKAVPVKKKSQVVNWVGTATNIESQKETEESLRDSEEIFRFMTESIPQQVWTANHKGELDYVNQSLIEYFGTSYEDIIKGGWQNAIHPEDSELCVRRWEHSLATGENYELEFRLKRKTDSTYRWHLGRALPLLDYRGNIIKWFGTNTDVDDQKRTEQEMIEQSEELERLNEELKRFSYISSHDLQEPLRSITSFIQLLAKKYKGKLDPEGDEYISFAVDGVNRIQCLINDVLSYSNVTRKSEIEKVNLQTALDNAIFQIKNKFDQDCLTITNDKLPVINNDIYHMTQIFYNLLSNAVKYKKAGDLKIHIGAEDKNNFWLFYVRDNGIGIESEYHEKIFLLFQRLHNRVEYSGTGLGLAICKKIVEQYGGNIWVESELGEGSTFYFTLPA